MEQSLKPLPRMWIDRIFSVLHGRFGKQFYDKFATGQVDENDNDVGIENAKKQWSMELAGYQSDRIRKGLNATYRYAPSCDDFKSQCLATPTAHKDASALLEKKIDRLSQKANAEKMAKQVNDLVGKTDHLAWAKRIIDNPKRFDNPQAIAKARQALGMEVQDGLSDG